MTSTPNPQGLLVTAGKVHVPFKTELLNSISSERFAKRPPHLVGILATKKEDARTYAEVSFRSYIVSRVALFARIRLLGSDWVRESCLAGLEGPTGLEISAVAWG